MRLYCLNFGLFSPLDGPDRRFRSMRGYLIETDDGERILVDTGMPRLFGDNPEAAFASYGLEGRATPVEMSPEQLVPGQLAKVGLQPDDLDLLILTHSDLDHLGGIDFVPDSVRAIISDAERALDVPAPTNPGIWDRWPSRTMETIPYQDVVLRPGIELIATPGHTPGHFSLLVTLPKTGPLLLAVDAIKMEGEIPAMGTNVEQAVASAKRVRMLAGQHGAMLVYGHDGDQWATLRHPPHYYD